MTEGGWGKAAPSHGGGIRERKGCVLPRLGAEKGLWCFAPEVGSIGCPKLGRTGVGAAFFLSVAALEEGQGGDKGGFSTRR